MSELWDFAFCINANIDMFYFYENELSFQCNILQHQTRLDGNVMCLSNMHPQNKMTLAYLSCQFYNMFNLVHKSVFGLEVSPQCF